MKHALYACRVMHLRLFPRRYRFLYRTFSLLLDLDALHSGARLPRLFSHNRFNLFSFHDRDHGSRGVLSLRDWAEALLATHDIRLEGGRIRLLCMPRVLGYGFNPISLWFCEHRDGGLRAVIAEVRNTFGEKHQYLLHASGRTLDPDGVWLADKRFHVSPFIGMRARYRFRLHPPDARLRLVVDERQDGARLLLATLEGRRRPFTDAELLRQFLRVPFQGLKVIALIHWQALRLWWRGVPVHAKPPAPNQEVTEACPRKNG